MIGAVTVNFHVRSDTPTKAVDLSTGDRDGLVGVSLGQHPVAVELLGQREDVERLLVAALEATRALGRAAAA